MLSPFRFRALVLVFVASGCAEPPPPVVEPPPPPPVVVSAPEPPPPPSPPKPPEPPPLPPVVFAASEVSAAPDKLPAVAITSPKKNAVVPAAKWADQEIRVDVKNWNLTQGGDFLMLVLDNRPFVRLEDPKRVLKLGDLAPASALDEGQHVLVAIPARASGETIKPVGKKSPAAAVSFFLGKKGAIEWKEGSPLLVLCLPTTVQAKSEGVLVDYYLLNADLSPGGYVVHASVSGPGLMAGESISKSQPWRIKDARPGLHAAQFSLFHFNAGKLESASSTGVTYTSEAVPGRWNKTTREFTVEPVH